MAAGSIIGATLGGLAVAYAPVAFLKVFAWMRVAGCGRQDRVCDFKLSIGAFCCTAYGRNWHFSEVTDEASDFRLGGQSRLDASVARTAAFDPKLRHKREYFVAMHSALIFQ